MTIALRMAGNDPSYTRYAAGCGNWLAFVESGISLDEIHASAAEWAGELRGVQRPWLCWNVDPDWCLMQQRLVKFAGWTPVVGRDARVQAPILEQGAIYIDFNKRLSLPTMWMHFPLEFVHLFCDRLAFWHADCLLRKEKMKALAEKFADLPDGAIAAVEPRAGIRGTFRPKQRRYWEVIGCVTRGASLDLFRHGCGWWVDWAFHPSNSEAERKRRLAYYWDNGAGIRYWQKKCGGTVQPIPNAYIAEGHFTGIGRADYKRASPKNFLRDLSKELSLNNDLMECCRKLGIEEFLADAPTRSGATSHSTGSDSVAAAGRSSQPQH